TVKALLDPELQRLARWIIVGDAWLVAEALEQQQARLHYRVVDKLPPADEPAAAEILVLDARQITPAQRPLGCVSADCGRAGLAYVRTAVEHCLAGRALGIVTAPLNKEAVTLAGESFCGHTEYIADLCGVDESRMLLVNGGLCVVHVTTHISLAAATRLDAQRILTTIELGAAAFVRLRGKRPRVAVCGLNPHAGENGRFGDADLRFIAPAVEAARREGIDCRGPFPADTLFLQAFRGAYDLVVAMYHDQGHIPMKLMDFEHTVNVTLGLPIIRTSVDHGTAFDIAGKNQASADDMQTAMRLAVRLATQQSAAGMTGAPA
ncbi:MAG: 4-hydroxythreonine-4-phosphate dehydrogenase PdxA, partial [Pirellulales bacterium]|nr:4-hydroxythreonine-4-phosphate dehydrogenase PdxA [Pirellulales bacterium]